MLRALDSYCYMPIGSFSTPVILECFLNLRTKVIFGGLFIPHPSPRGDIVILKSEVRHS